VLTIDASQAPVPEDGYPSGFVKGLASAYEGPEDVEGAGRWAAERILGFIRHQMHDVHIDYDEWFSQASIEESDPTSDFYVLGSIQRNVPFRM